MAEYLDFMALPKGAELAKHANMVDTMYDITSRQGEEALRQSQQNFDIGAALRELSANQGVEDFLGNQRAADFQTGLLKELAGMPEEQKAEYQTNAILSAIKNADVTRPESRRFIAGTVDYGTKVIADLSRQGKHELAQKLASALPGYTTVGSQVQAQQFMNPEFLAGLSDPVNVAAAGGIPTAGGKIRFGNVDLLPVEFAQIKAAQAANPNFNPLSVLAEIDKRNKQYAFMTDLTARAKALGVEVMVDPVTNQPHFIPRTQAATALAAGFRPASTGAAPTGMAQQQVAQPATSPAAPQAGNPAAAPAYALPAPVAAGTAPVYWPDPTGAGFAQAIMAQPTAPASPAEAGPSFWERLFGAAPTAPNPMTAAILAQPTAAPPVYRPAPALNPAFAPYGAPGAVPLGPNNWITAIR